MHAGGAIHGGQFLRLEAEELSGAQPGGKQESGIWLVLGRDVGEQCPGLFGGEELLAAVAVVCARQMRVGGRVARAVASLHRVGEHAVEEAVRVVDRLGRVPGGLAAADLRLVRQPCGPAGDVVLGDLVHRDVEVGEVVLDVVSILVPRVWGNVDQPGDVLGRDRGEQGSLGGVRHQQSVCGLLVPVEGLDESLVPAGLPACLGARWRNS
ncbi:hypothetical protein I2485_02595 [Nesterenkonia sp. E16_7]|nr:hypothetical protein [Nesterenkonia sp. E16_10]MBO0597535.1 hypothetical protein [Nesterenkonia sp. E16_7]